MCSGIEMWARFNTAAVAIAISKFPDNSPCERDHFATIATPPRLCNSYLAVLFSFLSVFWFFRKIEYWIRPRINCARPKVRASVEPAIKFKLLDILTARRFSLANKIKINYRWRFLESKRFVRPNESRASLDSFACEKANQSSSRNALFAMRLQWLEHHK